MKNICVIHPYFCLIVAFSYLVMAVLQMGSGLSGPISVGVGPTKIHIGRGILFYQVGRGTRGDEDNNRESQTFLLEEHHLLL